MLYKGAASLEWIL